MNGILIEHYFVQICGNDRNQNDSKPANESVLSLPPPGKEDALIIMNPFATNGRTAITTFILVSNDSTRRTVRRG